VTGIVSIADALFQSISKLQSKIFFQIFLESELLINITEHNVRMPGVTFDLYATLFVVLVGAETRDLDSGRETRIIGTLVR
jgi:hypothetical protein